MKSNRRARRQFTAEDKARFAAQAHRRRAAGETWGQISEDLDVLVSSLKLWMKQNPPKPEVKRSPQRKAAPKKRPAPKLAEVTVVDPVPAADEGGLVLTTPGGHRISGLSLASAAALLERLR
jgi:transposase-like protein